MASLDSSTLGGSAWVQPRPEHVIAVGPAIEGLPVSGGGPAGLEGTRHPVPDPAGKRELACGAGVHEDWLGSGYCRGNRACRCIAGMCGGDGRFWDCRTSCLRAVRHLSSCRTAPARDVEVHPSGGRWTSACRLLAGSLPPFDFGDGLRLWVLPFDMEAERLLDAQVLSLFADH